MYVYALRTGDGVAVGAFDGAFVGCEVGAEVGCEVGVLIGIFVGTLVGAFVGPFVGCEVGAGVGALDRQAHNIKFKEYDSLQQEHRKRKREVTWSVPVWQCN